VKRQKKTEVVRKKLFETYENQCSTVKDSIIYK